MVEAACMAVVFFFLLLGIFDFGQFLFVHQALVERARYAARWGAINDPTDTTSIQNMVMYYQTTAPTTASPYFGLKASNISVNTYDSGNNSYRMVLHISGYKYTVLSPYIGGLHTGPPITVSVPLGLFD
jgi:Flp pilus assembly protein TadG